MNRDIKNMDIKNMNLTFDKDTCNLCNIGRLEIMENGNRVCDNCYYILTTYVCNFDYECHFYSPHYHDYKKFNHFLDILN